VASANVELVRSVYEAWERRDYSYSDWADPRVEYTAVDGPEPGTWKGLAGMREGWRGWMSAWEDFRIRANEFRELDEERVLALDESGGRGKTSGAEARTAGAVVFHIRDGRVTRMLAYWDRARALADLGLPAGPA
jgi:ketosteroid isomerase-like protein